MAMARSGDVCGVFFLYQGTYHKLYAEWGDRIALPDFCTILWAVCEGIDELINKPDNATCVYVSPFGVVFGYDEESA